MLAVLEYLEPFPECFRCRATPGPTKRAEADKGQNPGRQVRHRSSMPRVLYRVDQIAAELSQPRQRALLVRLSETALSNDIGNQDRRKLPGLAHRAPGGAIPNEGRPGL